jgi:hypothetical protein
MFSSFVCSSFSLNIIIKKNLRSNLFFALLGVRPLKLEKGDRLLFLIFCLIAETVLVLTEKVACPLFSTVHKEKVACPLFFWDNKA